MRGFVPEHFARDWIAAWNRSDVDAVLVHYADNVVFVSPLAATVTGEAEVRGKSDLRAYGTKALASRPTAPQFFFESFAWDEQSRAFLIVYVSAESASIVRKCELMHFDHDGLIHHGEAFAGAVVS
jgi:hypothetical protein